MEQGNFIEKDNNIYIIISHSCDLARKKELEPFVEVIFCKKIDNLNGNMSSGKNPRELDISVKDENDAIQYFSLKATQKQFIEKEEIKSYYKTRDDLNLEDSIQKLQDWLASRYRRQSVPDNINFFLKKTLKLPYKIKSLKDELIGIWFAIDGNEGEQQTLTLYFIGNSENFVAEKIIKEKIKQFEDKNMTTSSDIELVCYYMSDSDISYYDITQLIYLNFDYLCT